MKNSKSSHTRYRISRDLRFTGFEPFVGYLYYQLDPYKFNVSISYIVERKRENFFLNKKESGSFFHIY